MNLLDLPFLRTVRNQMAWLDARQSAIAQNVANANTPGYRAIDVERPDFAALVEPPSGFTLAATNPRHLRDPAGPAAMAFAPVETPDSEISPLGNTVVLEDQMVKLAEASMEHQAASALYKKALGLLRIAYSGGR